MVAHPAPPPDARPLGLTPLLTHRTRTQLDSYEQSRPSNLKAYIKLSRRLHDQVTVICEFKRTVSQIPWQPSTVDLRQLQTVLENSLDASPGFLDYFFHKPLSPDTPEPVWEIINRVWGSKGDRNKLFNHCQYKRTMSRSFTRWDAWNKMRV